MTKDWGDVAVSIRSEAGSQPAGFACSLTSPLNLEWGRGIEPRSRRLQLRARPTWLTPHSLSAGTGGVESNSPSRVWSPRRSPEHAGRWLAGSGSNRPHSRLTAGCAHPECYLPVNWSGCGESNSELLLGWQRPFTNRHTRNWCRATESNGIPPLFRRLCAAATPARRIGCGGASRTRPSKGMNLARPRVSPHDG